MPASSNRIAGSSTRSAGTQYAVAEFPDDDTQSFVPLRRLPPARRARHVIGFFRHVFPRPRERIVLRHGGIGQHGSECSYDRGGSKPGQYGAYRIHLIFLIQAIWSWLRPGTQARRPLLYGRAAHQGKALRITPSCLFPKTPYR